MGENSAPVTGYTHEQQEAALTFNPSNDPMLQRIMELYAEIIDLCHRGRQKCGGGTERSETRQLRLFSIAISEARTAKLWAVKAITYRD